jgi:Restriction endonuclease BglII
MGKSAKAISHEVDHVRAFANGLVALEIEWNNKDPFFDRDLENYKRLHADGAISLGVIVTRGRSLHESMRDLVRRFLDERQIQDLDGLKEWGYEPTSRQRAAINKRISRAKAPVTFREAVHRQVRVRQVRGSDYSLEKVGGSGAPGRGQSVPARFGGSSRIDCHLP